MASDSTEEARRRWQRVQDLFHRARELEPARRRAFLEQHGSGDECLIAEVGELLEDASSDPLSGAARPPREDLSGQELGHYRLERIIGEGSMGVIYEARQRYVERSVALKILRRRHDVLQGGGSPESYERMTQRFMAEAEVLGLLDHPGIVPIHSVDRMGQRSGEEPRSYFTMRLVRGDDFRDIIARVQRGAGDWTLRRALGVVLRVCETMAFAHARGVLHRDLKPSHVMVGSFGEVYIVDWGLAKLPGRPEARDLRLREEPTRASHPGAIRAPTPLCTVEGDVIGTPAYMPPEQARGALGKLGVRSDVYALGALLYHLLVGRPPYLAPHEADERPSAHAVLGRVLAGAPPAVLALAPAVPAELAAICDKAMRREPEERYAGMDELADDLRAFLEHRVVTAHRAGALGALAKWMRRNRILAAALVLVPALLAGWGASVLVIQGARNRELARERDRARDQAAVASATTDFLDRMFRSLHPLAAQGETVTVRDALDQAAQRLDGAFPGQPLVEAAIRTVLGVAYHQLGLLDQAEPQLGLAYRTRLAHLGESDPATILALGEYGLVLGDLARFDEAEALLRRALELCGATSGPGARATLRAQGNLAQLLFDRGRLGEAESLARALLESFERAGGAPDEELLVALELLGSIHYRRDELDEAEACFRRQLELDRRLFGDGHSNTLIAATNLSVALDALGRHGEAFELCTELVEDMTRVFGARHRNTLSAAENLGIVLCNQGRTRAGIQLLTETLALEREVFGDGHPRTLLARYNLAEMLRRARLFDEALPQYEELVARRRALPGTQASDLRRALHGTADCLMDALLFEQAVEVLRELWELQRSDPGGPLADASDTALQLAACYEKLGWREELARFLAESSSGPPAPARGE